MMTYPTNLTAPDLATATLGELEEIISAGQQTFLEVGSALIAVRDGKMYKERGFKTFAEYCDERWGFGRARVYQLMDAAIIVAELSTVVDIPIPNERVARELAKVPAEHRVEVLERADKSAREHPMLTSQSIDEPNRRTDIGHPLTAAGVAVAHQVVQLGYEDAEVLEGEVVSGDPRLHALPTLADTTNEVLGAAEVVDGAGVDPAIATWRAILRGAKHCDYSGVDDWTPEQRQQLRAIAEAVKLELGRLTRRCGRA